MSKVFIYSAALSASVGVVNAAITANIMTYPAYDGELMVTGTFTFTGNKVSVDLSGLEMDTSGGVHIHEGMQCEDAGKHRWTPNDDPATDPWGPNTLWTSDADGKSMSEFTVETGYTEAEMDGRAVVVHASDGTKVACGILSKTPCQAFCAYNQATCGDASFATEQDCLDYCAWAAPGSSGEARKSEDTISCRLYHTHAASAPDGAAIHCPHAALDGGKEICVDSATMMTYPSYNGDLDITGSVKVWNSAPGKQMMNLMLDGLEAETTGGVHIHANMQCENAGLHFWTPATDPDDWKNTKWVSDATGQATNMVETTSGYNRADTNMHAVVVHTSAALNGTKVACGTIQSDQCQSFCAYNAQVCGTKSYADMATCMNDCAGYAAGSHGDARMSEDSRSCRLYHTFVASTVDLDVHCQHAAKNGGVCGATLPPSPEPTPEPTAEPTAEPPTPLDGAGSVALPNLGLVAVAVGLFSFLY